MTILTCNTTQNIIISDKNVTGYEYHYTEIIKKKLQKTLLWTSCDRKKEDKYLDDVDVEWKSSEHIFLRTDGVCSISNEQLSVISQKLQTHRYVNIYQILNTIKKWIKQKQIVFCKLTKVNTIAPQAPYSMCSQGTWDMILTVKQANNIDLNKL